MRRLGWIVAGVGGLVVAVLVVLNVTGVLPYPGGPLRNDPSAGILWLDTAPPTADEEEEDHAQLTGSGPWADWQETKDTPYIASGGALGGLYARNTWPADATIERVTLLRTTPGFELRRTWLDGPHREATIPGFVPASDESAVDMDARFLALPATLPGGEGRPLLVEIAADRPGPWGFGDVQIDYRVGPFTFRTVHWGWLVDGCLGPLPAGDPCSQARVEEP